MKTIQVEGYKAYHGKMLVSPKNNKAGITIGPCDWLYKPECDCWYNSLGSSFSAEICTVIDLPEQS